MSNYSATVVKITNLRPHSNADRLVCTNIFGNNIIVGKETKIGDLGLYFPLESQIGEEFARANDLIRRKDENGKPVGGMFDENRRVRAQQFRGERSMGFWIPWESLIEFGKYIGKPIDAFGMLPGDEISEFNGYTISQKYVPRRNSSHGGGGQKRRHAPRESKIIPNQFAFHFDTAQLGKNLHKINPNDLIALTWKLHGTSAIAGKVMTKKKLGLLSRLLKILGAPIKDTHYEMIYASRRVIKNEFEETKQHYYSYDLWTEVGKENFEGRLHDGETVYYEIVGYTRDGAEIQKGYDYGCEPKPNTDPLVDLFRQKLTPPYKVFVYRITMTAPDGTVTELQWNQVKECVKHIGVEAVPEIFYGKAKELVTNLDIVGEKSDEDWRKEFFEHLTAEFVCDQDSQFCRNQVPEEGIVLRKEGLLIEVYKLKSFRFLQHETKMLDKGEVDLETEQTVEVQ